MVLFIIPEIGHKTSSIFEGVSIMIHLHHLSMYSIIHGFITSPFASCKARDINKAFLL